jgi:hypothetical protein
MINSKCIGYIICQIVFGSVRMNYFLLSGLFGGLGDGADVSVDEEGTSG